MKPLRECVVLVTPRSFGAQAPELIEVLENAVGEVRRNRTGKPLAATELSGLMGDVDGLIAGLDDIDTRVFESAPRLKVVARYGVGVSNVDLEAASRHGVAVTNTPGANADAVAELTIALMFCLARSITTEVRSVESGSWKSGYGIEIAGKTVGVIGFGRVGRAVASRARALGCRVLAHDPFIPDEAIVQEAEPATKIDLIAESHFLTLHTPLTVATTGMVDRGFLRRMRRDAFLINTARGGLIVEPDLAAALDGHELAGAALDTLTSEPPSPDNPLLGREDVLITPHIGAHTVEATTAMGRLALDNLLSALSGSTPPNLVNSCQPGVPA